MYPSTTSNPNNLDRIQKWSFSACEFGVVGKAPATDQDAAGNFSSSCNQAKENRPVEMLKLRRSLQGLGLGEGRVQSTGGKGLCLFNTGIFA